MIIIIIIIIIINICKQNKTIKILHEYFRSGLGP